MQIISRVASASGAARVAAVQLLGIVTLVACGGRSGDADSGSQEKCFGPKEVAAAVNVLPTPDIASAPAAAGYGNSAGGACLTGNLAGLLLQGDCRYDIAHPVRRGDQCCYAALDPSAPCVPPPQ